MKAKKLIVLTLLVTLMVSTMACGGGGEPAPTPTPALTPTPELKHYTNSEFGYSIDYPEDWIFEKVDPSVITLRPDYPYTVLRMVVIWSFFAEVPLGAVPDPNTTAQETISHSMKAAGFTDFQIVNSEQISRSDWEITFTAFYETAQVEGEFHIKDAIKDGEPIVHILQLGHVIGWDWPEAQAVLDSFRIEP